MEILFWTCAFLIACHLFAYPAVMAALAKSEALGLPDEAQLPDLTVIVPVFNEAAVLRQKLQNLAALTYPCDKLQIVLAFDGCSDASVAIAQDWMAQNDPCDFRLHVHAVNRGKIAVLNEEIAACRSAVVALSDASALLPADALQTLAAQFADRSISVVCPAYHLPPGSEPGQERYWAVQRRIKAGESASGCASGPHGACYLFRRALWSPVPADTINDDFILPMSIVARSGRALYVSTVAAQELEISPPALDFRRRIRISAGNLQQSLRLMSLLSPRRGRLALIFFFGKWLRGLLPLLAMLCIASTVWLGFEGRAIFLLLDLALGIAALLALSTLLGRAALPSLLLMPAYAMRGLIAGIIGTCLYLLGKANLSWRLTQRAPAQKLNA